MTEKGELFYDNECLMGKSLIGNFTFNFIYFLYYVRRFMDKLSFEICSMNVLTISLISSYFDLILNKAIEEICGKST